MFDQAIAYLPATLWDMIAALVLGSSQIVSFISLSSVLHVQFVKVGQDIIPMSSKTNEHSTILYFETSVAWSAM